MLSGFLPGLGGPLSESLPDWFPLLALDGDWCSGEGSAITSSAAKELSLASVNKNFNFVKQVEDICLKRNLRNFTLANLMIILSVQIAAPG